MEFLAYGLVVVAIGGAVLAIVAFFKNEGGVEGRSNNSVPGKPATSNSAGVMSATDEGNAHSGVDGYQGGSYNG